MVTMNYLEYAVSIKDKIVATADEFPVITICLNSMHSRRKVDGILANSSKTYQTFSSLPTTWYKKGWRGTG